MDWRKPACRPRSRSFNATRLGLTVKLPCVDARKPPGFHRGSASVAMPPTFRAAEADRCICWQAALEMSPAPGRSEREGMPVLGFGNGKMRVRPAYL